MLIKKQIPGTTSSKEGGMLLKTFFKWLKVFFKELEPEPEPVKNGPAQQHWEEFNINFENVLFSFFSQKLYVNWSPKICVYEF